MGLIQRCRTTGPRVGNAAAAISSESSRSVALCLERGHVTAATIADHIEPHRGDYTAFRLGALRSLCAECHDLLDRG